MAQTATKKLSEKLSEQISETNKPNSEVVKGLQQQVANAFILYLNYKHYHWQTFGPLFRDLHRLFDEFAEEVFRRWRESEGCVAEAMAGLGDELAAARDAYGEVKQLDETLFAKNYESL